jgi:hypothetical protein
VAYQSPKVDWTSVAGVTDVDMNRIEGNIADIKANLRTDTTAASAIEVRTGDPSAPAVGRVWLISP